MEEILALQAQLMRVQEEKPLTLLSERNAMEILNYLKRERGLQVVSTLDGKEFMTLKRLDDWIYEVCLMQKKIRINELENILNVSSDIIQTRITGLIQKQNLFFQNNQFLTQQFIQMIMLDVDDQLKTHKICDMYEIAAKHDIEVDFLVSFMNNPLYSQTIEQKFQIDKRTNLLIS